MKITKMISKNINRFHGVNPCDYITIHQTGNTKKGANALNHAKFINNGSRQTWHYTVDSKHIVQHFDDSVQCWHCGDGEGKGNKTSIGIEMCVNSDDDYNKAFENLVWLIQVLMKRHNIPITHVVQHSKWSGKNCPQQLRSGVKGITWGTLLERLRGRVEPVRQTSQETIHQMARDVINGKYGNGEQRKRLLGSHYVAVQQEVNNIMKYAK